eukprot:gene4477-28633_t
MATKDRIKLVIVGDGACGKSCLLRTFEAGSPQMEYITTFFENSDVDIDYEGKSVELALWDTAGQEDYDRLRPLSYPDTDVVLICYSISDPYSLENVPEKWVLEIRHSCPGVQIILVGLKSDARNDQSRIKELAREGQKPVPSADARAMAEKIGAFDYVECSAKENEGLLEVFHSATRAAMCKSKGKRSFLKSILGGGAAKTPETAKLKEEALAIKAKAKEEAAAEKARVKQIQTEEKAEKARVKAAATAAAQAFNWHKRAASARAKAIKVRMKAEADEKKWLKTATPLQIKKRHREKAADAAAAAAAAAAREAFMSGPPVAPPSPSAPVVVESAYETLATTMQQKRPCPYVSSKGSCNRMFVAGAHVTFCMMHTCTKVGCNAKKTSRDDFCPQHVDGPKEKAPELPPLPASFAPPSSPPLQPVSHTPTSPTPLFDATNPFGPPPTLATSVNVNTSTDNPFGDGGISDDENDYDTCDTATDPSEMAAFEAQPMRVSKYLAKIRLGKQEQTALGLEDLMGVDDDLKSKFLSIKEEAIKQEFALNGTEEDKDNLKHVLAGTYRKDWGRSVAENRSNASIITAYSAPSSSGTTSASKYTPSPLPPIGVDDATGAVLALSPPLRPPRKPE